MLTPCGFIAAILLLALGTVQTPAQGAEPKPPTEASRLEILSYIKNSNYRKNWRLFPRTKAFHNGQDPHGTLLTVYVNDAALSGLLRAVDTMPYGSMLIKENYMPDKELASITVMYKVKGFNPRDGDWYWLKELADGTVESAGKVESCIACHKKAERDFVLPPKE